MVYSLDRMQAGVLGGARANGLQVLKVSMTATCTLEVTVEQPTHNLLIIGDMTVLIQPEDMGLAG